MVRMMSSSDRIWMTTAIIIVVAASWSMFIIKALRGRGEPKKKRCQHEVSWVEPGSYIRWRCELHEGHVGAHARTEKKTTPSGTKLVIKQGWGWQDGTEFTAWLSAWKEDDGTPEM